MYENESAEVEGTDLEPRDVRALTQYLTVLEDVGRARHAADLYLVVSESGREYLVDARTDTCECPDHAHRGVLCKHARRVAFATGARAIPAWINPTDVDAHLGMHVAGTPRVVVTDGGRALPHDVAEQVTDDEIAAREERAKAIERPADCACWDTEAGLPCWPCFRDGFGSQNPAEPAAEIDE